MSVQLRTALMTPQFTSASVVYYTASTLFPAKETFIPEAIIEEDDSRSSFDEDKKSIQHDLKVIEA